MGCGGRALFHSAAAGGIDVATQGIASPPTSPPLRTVSPATAASKAKAPSKPVVGRKSRPAKGAAYTIAGECERLFCGALRAAFLGERSAALQNPLAVGVRKTTTEARDDRSSASMGGSSGTEDWGAGVHGPRAVKATSYPSPEPDGFVDTPKGAPLHGILESWVEVWDYVGGGRFRGFVASGTSCGNEGERILFIFLDEPSGEFDLRPGMLAMLELCSVEEFNCSRMVTCVSRGFASRELQGLLRDLAWAGFELCTLKEWTQTDGIISKKWIFTSTEV